MRKIRLWLIILGVVAITLVGFLSLRSARPIVELKAETLFSLGSFSFSLGPIPLFDNGFPITNTILTSWIVVVLLSLLFFFGTRRMALVPRGLQNFVEMVLEALYNMAVGTAGEKHGRRFFPVIATIFLYVVAANWLGLLPGVATIGKVDKIEDKGVVFQQVGGLNVVMPGFPSWPPHEPKSIALTLPANYTPEQQETALQNATKDLSKDQRAGLLVPFFRSVNTDLNATLMLAIMSAIFVEFWGISTQGFFRYAGKFFNFKNGPIGFFVGILEFVAEAARLLSFTFRLFGNIFAGEMLFLVILFLLPVIALDFVYGLELFVGIIQAFIFAMLTLVFGVIAVTSHEEGGDSHEHEPVLPA